MRDPHIERLYFRIAPEQGMEYRSPAPLSFSTTFGKFETRSAELIATPNDHFGTEEGALAVLDPFLRSWEVEADLTIKNGAIRFKFDRADVIDRDPPSDGSLVVNMKLRGSMTFVVRQVANEYPPPPANFQASSEVLQLHHRWQKAQADREQLLSMANVLLTYLESDYESLGEKRKRAAQAFNVERDVLNKVGELCATRGNVLTARKITATMRELSNSERRWLEEAAKLIILRIGEQRSNSSAHQISMQDLPPIQ